MTTYFIGDIQGCYKELNRLLERVNFCCSSDELWVAGDMVARGPDSLATINLLMSMGKSIKPVLGNHDLHLLSIIAGIKPEKQKDLLSPLLAASNLNDITEWLAKQPLLRQLPDQEVYMSHAGISPQWSTKEAKKQAKFAHKKLQSKKRNFWLKNMYGQQPSNWQDVSNDIERFRYTINAFTRMRYCFKDQSLEFDCKSPPKQAPKNIKPWYENNKALKKCDWVFGHWAALMGECPLPNVYALDTGCVWGGKLTMLNWDNKRLISEKQH